MTVGVRPAQAADAPDLARLFTQLGHPATAGDLAPRLETPADATVLVAHDGDAVTGVLVMHVFAPLHVAQPWAVISALVVDEDVRSSGAGARLIAAAQGIAASRACAHVELSCSEKRTRAHAFYVAQGFQEVRKRFIQKL